MKRYEKEAFLKTFGIFFISLLSFASILASFYYNEQKHIMEEQIFIEMKAFTYDFKSSSFKVDIVSKNESIDEFNLQPCPEGMCGYFPLPNATNSFFKVILPQEKFDELLQAIFLKVVFLYTLVFFSILLFALFYSFYALHPLKKALHLLEEFLKDLIHDLNTPVTSILLNTQWLAKQNPSEALERIELGAKTISSLHKNLEAMHNGFIQNYETIELSNFLHVRANPFQKLYPHLTFHFNLSPYEFYCDIDALSRIVDNLLSNACKYNTKKGQITLSNDEVGLCIEDTGLGIKNIRRIFDRYYKESSRGMGIGLHIVKKYCDALNIKITIESQLRVGTKVCLTFPKAKQ